MKVKVTAAGDGSTHETTKSPKQSKQVVAKSKAGIYHQLMVAVAVIYMGTQAFLPYSHFITKVRGMKETASLLLIITMV